jgi:hypothetical protein
MRRACLYPWYVPRALGAWLVERRRAARTIAFAGMPVVAMLAAGCGGTTAQGDRQDKDEPSGNFPVSVEDATFPLKQDLAQSSKMKIVVRNAGNQRIPNIAVTVQCEDEQGGQNGSFDRQITGQGVADKNRPNFVVDRIPGADRPASRQQLDELERSSAYVNTYTLGPLAPNRTATFEWDVTAVRAGDFRLCYRVAAGLDGKAKAVAASGSLPIAEEWNGVVSSDAPNTGVADDGETITTLPEETKPAP